MTIQLLLCRGVAFRILLKTLLAAFLCNCCQAFFFMVHPYSSIDTNAVWKKLRLILSEWSDFHMTDSLLIAVFAFASHVLMSFSVDETQIRR